MKRFILMLIAGGVAAGAVYGAAATLGGATSQNIAADSADVISCDNSGVRVQYTIAQLPAAVTGTAEGFSVVDDATVDHIADDCAGKELKLTLFSGGTGMGSVTTTLPATWPSGTVDDRDVTLDVDGALSNVRVSEIESVEVMINDPPFATP